MTTSTEHSSKLLFNLRLINYFISSLAFSLTIWMSIGERVLLPLCELKIFDARKDSCYRNGALEMRDRASLVLLVAVTAFFLILFYSKKFKAMISKDSRFNSIVDKTTFLVIVTTISMRSYYPSFDDWTVTEFSGFGFDIAFFAAICALTSSFALANAQTLRQLIPLQTKNLRFLKLSAVFIFFGFYFPSVLQIPSGLSSRDDAVYVLNELLAPTAETFPLSSSIPQYTALLGFPIVPSIKIFGSSSIFLVTTIWLTIMTLTILAALTTIWRRIFPQMPRSLGLLGVSALLLAASADVPRSLNLASLPSWTVRFFLPSLVALALLSAITTRQKKSKDFKFSALGAMSSICVLNNFEFGATAVISVFLALFGLVIRQQVNLFQIFNFLISLFITTALIYQAYLFQDEKIQINYLTFFSREFGANGFGSWPMPIIGIYVLVFAIAGLALIFSFIRLMDSKNADQDKNQVIMPVIGLAIFAGSWTITSSLYYAGRSVDGSLRVVFIPALIAFLAVFKLLGINMNTLTNFAIRKFTLIPTLIIVFLPIALIIKAPNPWLSWSRVTQKENDSSWSLNSTKNRPIVNSYKYLDSFATDEIGIMAFDGNAISIVTGAKNLLAVNSLADLTISDRARNFGCKKLEISEIDLVLVEGAYDKDDKYPCSGLKDPKIQLGGESTLFRFKPNTP